MSAQQRCGKMSHLAIPGLAPFTDAEQRYMPKSRALFKRFRGTIRRAVNMLQQRELPTICAPRRPDPSLCTSLWHYYIWMRVCD